MVIKILYERRVRLYSGFYAVGKEGDAALIGAFIDVSHSDAQVSDMLRKLEGLEGVLEVNVSEETSTDW